MKHLLRAGSDGASLEPDGYNPRHAQTTTLPYDYFVADLIIENLVEEFPRPAGFQRLLEQAREKLDFVRRCFSG